MFSGASQSGDFSPQSKACGEKEESRQDGGSPYGFS
jgi:hypothetical protein